LCQSEKKKEIDLLGKFLYLVGKIARVFYSPPCVAAIQLKV
jgi:hypothetical protein